MVLGKLDNYMQKNETEPFSYPIYKTNSKQIKDLNVRPETINLPEENIGGKPLDISFAYDFFGFDMKIKDNESKNKQ